MNSFNLFFGFVIAIFAMIPVSAHGQTVFDLEIVSDSDSRVFDLAGDNFVQVNQFSTVPDAVPGVEGFFRVSGISGHTVTDPDSFVLQDFIDNFPANFPVGVEQLGEGETFFNGVNFTGGTYSVVYENTVTNSGVETADITAITFDLTGDIGGDIAGFEFTSSETGTASGTVELLDGEVTGVNATAPYTVTLTPPAFSGLFPIDLVGALVLDCAHFAIDVDESLVMAGVLQRVVIDIRGDITNVVNANILLGDVNKDGEVNFLDIGPFIALLSGGGLQPEGDINEDGAVNFLDISPFIGILLQ